MGIGEAIYLRVAVVQQFELTGLHQLPREYEVGLSAESYSCYQTAVRDTGSRILAGVP